LTAFRPRSSASGLPKYFGSSSSKGLCSMMNASSKAADLAKIILMNSWNVSGRYEPVSEGFISKSPISSSNAVSIIAKILRSHGHSLKQYKTNSIGPSPDIQQQN